QQALLSVGQEVPRIMGNTSTQGVITPNIVDRPVNLLLRLNPTISPEGTIVIGIFIQKDKVGGTIKVGDQEMQTLDTANMVTMISAANNQTVVLGGLITKEETTDLKKVPVLGDIPLLGKFFRQELDRTIRKELLVILTPRIVQSHEELDQIKQIEMARMSWCLKNVVETVGDLGAYTVRSSRPYTGNAPVFTPGPVPMETLQPIHAPVLPMPMLPRN
ncbi:MAG: type II and III secretion system protein, partial [Planctomycetaceae bacterium]|nr:type II and III secretion system protein [Planctomycetaceae bacterium]